MGVKIKVENPETIKNDEENVDKSNSYSSCLSEQEDDTDLLGCSNCLSEKFKTKQTQEENVLLKKQMKAKDEHIDRLTESNNRVKRIYRERNASQTERIQDLENDNNLLKEKMSRINELEEEVRKLKAENCQLAAERTAEKRKSITMNEKLKEEIKKKQKSIEDQLRFWNNEKSDLDETINSEWEEPSLDDISEDNNMNVHLRNFNENHLEPPLKKFKDSD